MEYFNHHPIFDYGFGNGNTYQMVDIFRRNHLAITDNNCKEHITTNNETMEKLADLYYDDPRNSWILNLANDIQSISELKISTDLKITEAITKYEYTKVYSIITLPNIRVGDILIDEGDFPLDISVDPYVVVKAWDPYLRAITVSEVGGNSFAAGATLSIIRENTTNETYDVINEIQIKKKTDYINFPIKFTTFNNIFTSPYIYATGVTFVHPNSLGITFANTLLYDFMDDQSHVGNYNIVTPMQVILTAEDNSIYIPNSNAIGVIENQMRETLNIVDKFRVYNITIE